MNKLFVYNKNFGLYLENIEIFTYTKEYHKQQIEDRISEIMSKAYYYGSTKSAERAADKFKNDYISAHKEDLYEYGLLIQGVNSLHRIYGSESYIKGLYSDIILMIREVNKINIPAIYNIDEYANYSGENNEGE